MAIYVLNISGRYAKAECTLPSVGVYQRWAACTRTGRAMVTTPGDCYTKLTKGMWLITSETR